LILAVPLQPQLQLAPHPAPQQMLGILERKALGVYEPAIPARRDGEDLGRVLQLNEVPAGSLNGLWGDVALVVAEEAAGGVRDVIANAGGLTPAPTAPAGPAR
jgi:hypothetical protein